MGLINYVQLDDGDAASANAFNERFGQIVNTLNGNLDSANFKAGGIPVSALADSVFEKMWPVGSIYTNAAVNTNPASLLGFGTWTSFGTGRVLVGVDADQTEFSDLGKTGGDKNLQSHTHVIDPPATNTTTNGDHAHQTHIDWNVANGSGEIVTGASTDTRGNNTTTNGAHAHTVDIAAFDSATAGTGSGQNLQPYITVYMWRRTA